MPDNIKKSLFKVIAPLLLVGSFASSPSTLVAKPLESVKCPSLEGFSSGASMNRMQDGTYLFELRAADEDGVFDKVKVLLESSKPLYGPSSVDVATALREQIEPNSVPPVIEDGYLTCTTENYEVEDDILGGTIRVQKIMLKSKEGNFGPGAGG